MRETVALRDEAHEVMTVRRRERVTARLSETADSDGTS